jgi:nitrite reductase (NO-forming)
MGAAIAALMVTTPAMAGPADDLKLPRERVTLVAPPAVHPHEQATKAGPKIVEFKLTIREKEVVIDDAGTKFHAMTFDGSMPGPMMVLHEGDYMELTLVNPETNSMPHNIDLHSATGGLGGGALTHVNPGEQVVLRWKATRPGVFVYHCAPEGMIPWHVVSGMHGTVMVLPRDGLKDAEGKALRYDKIFYIGENDLYVPKEANGKYKSYETVGESFADTTEVMRKLIPTHVVFNGRVGSLTGKNAMTAKVGETVMIVHSQANRDTRPHLIGGHGDYVWETGKFNNPPEKDLETWFVRGGSAGAAIYTFREPGIYAYVNHNLIEAVELGAAAHFKVEGKWNDDLMKQITPPGPIPPAKLGAADPVAVTR